jgi:hypothetical protein
MSQIMPTSAGTGGVYVFDTLAAPWTETGMDGVVQKTARTDRESGCSLGLLSFNRTAASGLHQHHGVATNFVLSGSLSDYQDDYPIGSVITNLAGTTHDEISWNGCMLVSRTEGPIVYLPKAAPADANQSGGHDLYRNPAPDRPPSLDRPLRSIRTQMTSIPRLSRRTLFDYLPTDDNRRWVELSLWPEMSIPTHRVSALTEWMVLAGFAQINSKPVPTMGFAVIEPNTEVTISSPFGCRLLAWAEGPVAWSDGIALPDLYGF